MNPIMVYVRDSGGSFVGYLDAYSKLTFITKYNAVGKWTMDIDRTTLQYGLLSRLAGISLQLNGVTLTSGYITGIKRTKTTASDIVTFAGECDKGVVGWRQALPDTSGPPFTSQEYDVRSGVGETVIKNYVKYNAGSLAQAARQIAGFSVATDLARGSQAVGRARFDDLDELVSSLATTAGLAWDVKDLVFDVRVPSDKSDVVVFSEEIGNMSEFTHEISQPDDNFLYVGGSGSATSRAFSTASDSQSIIDWRRIEKFLNYDKTAVTAELTAAGNEDLAKRANVQKLDIENIQIPGRELFVDYFIGDKVGVIIDGEFIKFIASEAEITLEGSGLQTVKPTLSVSNIPIGLLRGTDQQKKDQWRLDRLEKK
jgi:hypothetical protein